MRCSRSSPRTRSTQKAKEEEEEEAAREKAEATA
jgi:hypothetical protein